MVDRPAVRIVCVDERDRVLLLRWRDPADGSYVWEPPGGGVESGERPIDTARRELFEETGLPGAAVLDRFTMVRRNALWNGERYDGEEAFFLARFVNPPGLTRDRLETYEAGWLDRHEWVPWDQIAGLADAVEPPEILAVLSEFDPVARGPALPGGGMHVALMGIDGAGKSTLAHELAVVAERRGVAVRTVSWRSVIEPGHDRATYPVQELRRLWLRSFRMYFADALGPDGTALDLPQSYEELNSRGGTEYLNGVVVSGQPPEGPLACAWIELAANTLLHHEVIRPLVNDGFLVLQESYGYKHLLKLFAYADGLSHSSTSITAHCRAFARSYFGNYLKPDLGIYVSTPPEVALRWRTSQGSLGTFETYATAGADPQQSFVRMQAETAASFDDFAAAFGWTTIAVRDVDRPENRQAIWRVLRTTPLAVRLGLNGPEATE